MLFKINNYLLVNYKPSSPGHDNKLPERKYIMAKRVMERDWDKRTITILGKVYDYTGLSPVMKDLAGFLGFGTKLVDNLAGMKAYSQEEKLKKVDKVYASLMKGEWRVPGTGEKITAKVEREKIFAAFEKATKEQKKVMRLCLKGQYEFPADK